MPLRGLFYSPSLQQDRKMTKKLYVLDTNVLIHDPECIFKFEDNDVVIPFVVIEELDSLKANKTPCSADARRASQAIKSVLEDPTLVKGGVFVSEKVKALPERPFTADNIIIGCAVYYFELYTSALPVILVTKDVNMWIKARALGLRVEDYNNDATDGQVVGNCEILREANLEPSASTKYACYPGEGDRPPRRCVYKKGTSVPLKYPNFFGIEPRNQEQALAMCALEDDNDFVCLEGKAGSGKSLLATAYTLEMVLEKKRFKKVIVMRTGDNNAIGFLPGTESDKMSPWLQGFYDNLEVLVGDEGMTVQHVIEKANIKFRSLDLVRGRSYQDTLIIAEEVQNNTPHQMKALLTRAGEGSQIVLLGNLAQIDTPYLNKRTSGLTHVMKNMLSYPKGAICIFNEVHRSALTAYAEEHL